MLTAPPGFFTVFHRHLPQMEVLVIGSQKEKNKMYVTATCMENVVWFTKDIAPGEKLIDTMQAILHHAQARINADALMQKELIQKAGWHVH